LAIGKKDLTDIIAEKTGLTKKQTAQYIEAFIETVGEELAAGEKVLLSGFGTFLARESGAREGRNPRTGEIISIPAKTVPAFKPGITLRDLVE